MTDVETRLRDALSTRASAVTYDASAYDAIVRRRARRPLARLTVPVGAVGAVATAAALVGILAVVVRLPETAGPAGGGPARLAAVRDGRAVVLDRSDLDGAPLAQSPAEWGSAGDVAALGDGVTFYGTARARGECPSVVFRMTADGRVEKVLDVPGPVVSLAVSPDGQRLAYALQTARRRDPCGGDVDVHVRHLATGKEKVWRGYLGVLTVRHLAWSPDGRYLAYDSVFSVSRIDTRARAGRLPKPLLENFQNPFEPGRCWSQAPSYLPSLELVVLVSCENPGYDDKRTHRAVVLDPVTRTFGRVVLRLPNETGAEWLSFDRTGSNALVGVTRFDHRDSSHGDAAIYWWHAGEPPRRVSGAPAFVERVAW